MKANYLDKLIPDRVRAKKSTYRKAIYFMKACWYTGLFLLLFSIVIRWAGVVDPTNIILLSVIGFWSLPFIFSAGLRFIIACNIYILFGTSLLTYTALYTGGFHSPIMYWFTLVPLAGLLMVNKVSTFLWTGVALLNVLYFGIMNVNGNDFPTQIDPNYAHTIAIISVAILVIIIFILALVFDDMTKRAFNELKRNNNMLIQEKQKSDNLLLNILPAEVANELKETGITKAKEFEQVTILFTDFVNFTQWTEKLSPEALVAELNECFIAFDNIIEKHGLEKIKTIGDAYMAVSGMPSSVKDHALRATNAAIDIQNYISMRREKDPNFFNIRIGIHTGSVVAGIVGLKKFVYDIWGDNVNIAARIEQNGKPGKINISYSTYQLIHEHFDCNYRGEIDAKNKGKLKMYFVEQPEMSLITSY
jgi:class 3 adenylate cyclase